MNDTSPDIQKMIHERLMALPGVERFRMGVEMFEAARRVVVASLPEDLPKEEKRRRLYERIYGEFLPEYSMAVISLDVKQTLIAAIKKRQVLQFSYNGEEWIVEPQTYGLSTAGKEVLRGYQRSGAANRGSRGWRNCSRLRKFPICGRRAKRFQRRFPRITQTTARWWRSSQHCRNPQRNLEIDKGDLIEPERLFWRFAKP